jgi:hypothetical protein
VTQHRDFPLRAARGSAARGNGTTVHNASYLAAGHKTAAGTAVVRSAAVTAP